MEGFLSHPRCFNIHIRVTRTGLMPDIRIIKEADAAADTGLLSKLWSNLRSFAFVLDKNGVSDQWLHQVLQIVPKRFREGCFGILTSGSTGEPKLILGKKQRSEKLVHVLHKSQDSEPVAETVCALPLSYSYALINQWLWSHVFGRPLRLTPGFSEPDTLMRALQVSSDAMLCLVGTQVALIRRFFPDAIFPGIIRLHFAGGRFPQEELEFLHERFPNAKIFNNYGCAEAMPRLTLRKAEAADDAAHVGWTLPGIEMKSGEDDKLLFRSPYQAVAYIDDSGFHELTPEEWIPSGDMGRQQEDGSWILLGRASEVFKRFGEKVSLPKVLTTVRSRWTGDAACFPEVDAAGEQAFVLVLSPEPSKEQLREVLMEFRKNHKRPHWPLRVESMDQLPILANGKTDLVGLKNASSKIIHWKQRI